MCVCVCVCVCVGVCVCVCVLCVCAYKQYHVDSFNLHLIFVCPIRLIYYRTYTRIYKNKKKKKLINLYTSHNQNKKKNKLIN